MGIVIPGLSLPFEGGRTAVRIVTVHPHPVCKSRIRPAAIGHILTPDLEPFGVHQAGERTLYGRPPAAQQIGNSCLRARPPAELIGVAADQAQHLKVAPFEAAIGDSTGRDDRVARLFHQS